MNGFCMAPKILFGRNLRTDLKVEGAAVSHCAAGCTSKMLSMLKHLWNKKLVRIQREHTM